MWKALGVLGYRVASPFEISDPTAKARIFSRETRCFSDIRPILVKRAVEIAKEFDAAADNPWPLLYRDLDQHFPGSRFILMVRDPQRWFDSMMCHFGSSSTVLREWIYGYGSPQGHREAYLEGMKRHNEQVREHFAGRSEDLLEMDLEAGHGWKRLCGFLDCPQPNRPFPHANKRTDRA